MKPIVGKYYICERMNIIGRVQSMTKATISLQGKRGSQWYIDRKSFERYFKQAPKLRGVLEIGE